MAIVQEALEEIADAYISNGFNKQKFMRDCVKAYDNMKWLRNGIE